MRKACIVHHCSHGDWIREWRIVLPVRLADDDAVDERGVVLGACTLGTAAVRAIQ
jgi:hypothetical protein